MTEKIKIDKAEYAAKYFLLTVALSFFGWAFENGYMLLRTGKFYDTGFLRMPICPIYGCSILCAYFLAGTPNRGRGVLRNVRAGWKRNALYAVFALLVPTVAEWIVGAFFDRLFGVRLWSYQGMPYAYRGYVCLPVSLLWAVLLFLFMKYAFTPLKRLFFRMDGCAAKCLSLALFFAVFADFIASYAALRRGI